MFKEIVEVVEVLEDKVKVRFSKQKMCECCSYSSLCHQGRDEITIPCNNRKVVLKKGDRIEIGIEEKKTIIASFFLFLMPGIIFLSFLVIFRSQQEFISFLLAILAVFAYYLTVKVIMRRKGKYFNLRIIKKI
jgi:positive regulator of sigma E activity